ncbi:MAG: hypothetical protein COB67_03015 [SAR324 cluster bacterium]|uniref:OmpA-like domain-containing protein n=1 Tax=SAR324 cluster bacterium TaxID=2024889 RepID=A0A2A4T8E3_9DELT|nr:MAG: hypothetical protein COB67_03015 [SAR324 cluster bacterium]
MNYKLLKSLCFLVTTSSLVALLAGCSTDKSTKPWDSAVLGKTSFSFQDTDPSKGKIGGILKLANAPKLNELGMKSFLIYWGDSADNSGKKSLLKEVSDTQSDNSLYKIPHGTDIKGKYFQLYVKDTENKENFGGQSVAVKDLIKAEPEPANLDANQPKQVVQPQQISQPEQLVQPGQAAQPEQATQPEQAAQPEQATQPEQVAQSGDVKQKSLLPPKEGEKSIKDVQMITPAVVVPGIVSAQPGTPTANDSGSISTIPLIVIENALFAFDQSSLQADYRRELEEILEPLENKTEKKLLVSGHADERGSNEYNLALGERRAHAVKVFLISLGFPEENITIVSFGEEKPLSSGQNEAAWSKNRRAETVELPTE